MKGVSPYVERNYQSPSEIQGSFPAGAGGQGKRGAADHLKMGARSFPNKRILRNNLCLPACKLLYLDKREKNFLLTDIISDIIIVRN